MSYSATDGDAQAPSATSYIGSLGTGDGKLQRPQGVALDGEGNIWVVDKNNYRIQKFDKNGKFLLKVGGTQGTNPGQFSDTRSIAVTSNGTVWVSEINGRLQAFDGNGKFIRQIHQDVLNQAVGIAPAPGGMLWVSDPGASRVYKVNETTGALPSYVYGSSTNPTGPAKLPYPSGLAADGMGGVWVADPVNDRIQKFDASGKFVTQFGVSGKGPGQLDGTLYIAVARSGNLLVTDEFSNRVQVYRPDGTFLREFGTTGSSSGQFTEVRGIAVNSSNEAFVADAGNGRVHKWSHADLDKQSGVVSTEVKVDGQAVEPKYAPGCPTENCAISKAWTLKAIDYAAGQHNVQVTATDGVGLSTTKSLTITTAKDTAGPQLTANNSFYTAPEGWLDQETYSYSASASDATYGVTSFSLKIDGKVISSKTQSCSNGGCGASISGSINMATYKGGAHSAELIATDAGGNTTKKAWTINVNPEGTVSAVEAVATLDAVDGTSGSTIVAPVEEAVDPAEREAGNDPALKENGEMLESTGTANPATISIDPSGGFTVESSVDPLQPVEQLHVEPVSTGEDSTPMVVAEEVAATSANSTANVDTVIRPVFNGVFDYQSIRNVEAPEEYSWKIQLSKAQILKVIDKQYAAVEYENGDIAYAIIAEPAHDAVGTTIETSFSVTGNIITLIVPHGAQKYVYPVTSGVGWEGGFTTSLAVMPPPEEEAASGMETFSVVWPPEPAGYGDPDDATASKVQTLIKRYGYYGCELSFEGGCTTWKHKIKGFFFYNGRYAWWKDRDPVCENDTFLQIWIDVEYCDWIGPNHQKYGNGHHITSQTRFTVYKTVKGLTGGKDHALTIRMYGSGGWYGHPTTKVCNPSRPDC